MVRRDFMAKICPECGTNNTERSEFCQECGKKLDSVTEKSKSENSFKALMAGFNKWWGKRSRNGKILYGIGACCLGVLIIGMIGAALTPERTILGISNATGSGVIQIDNKTTEYVVKGYSEPNATVTVDGQPLKLDANNQFTYKVNIPLATSEKTLRFKAEKTGKSANYYYLYIKRPSPTTTTTQPATTTPVQAPTWHSVAKFTGTGDKDTDTFSTKGDRFKVKITATTTSLEYGQISFYAYPEGETASYVGQGSISSFSQTTQTDEFFVTASPGNYYISVIAANLKNWKVEVFDYY